jgi:methyltransferase
MGLNSSILFAILPSIIVIERLQELNAAKLNTREILAIGGREFGASHYPVIVSMHVLFFESLVTEFVMRDKTLPSYFPFPLILFVLAQGLRFWTRSTMKGRWTTRVLVIPGEKLIHNGPFRFLHHPNYIAVAMELFSLPLIFGLFTTCILFSILNAIMLLFIRIPCERSALEWSQQQKITRETAETLPR